MPYDVIPGQLPINKGPYRLPEIINAVKNGYAIFIADGEAKADKLRSFGFTATSIPDKSCAQANAEVFHGAEVVLMRDEATNGLIDEIGLVLCKEAKSIFLLTLPNSDNVTGDEIDELYQKAPQWSPNGNGAAEGISQGPKGIQEAPILDLEPEIEPIEMFDAGDWEGVPIEQRQWITQNQIPASEPGILSGDGGTGKTMIAIQLGCSVGAGWPDWLGKLIETHGPVMLYSVEEKLKEFHARTSWVLESRGGSFSDLRNRFYFIGDRKDETILGRVDRYNGLVVPTKTLLRLEKRVAQIKPALVIVENAADVFAGNENDRSQVHPFVRCILGGLCEYGATMMLLQHPSVSGLSDGTGRAGSTGWNNAGRWRLNFKTSAKDDEGVDDGRRQLVTVKANYGRRGEKVNVEWRAGIFVPEGSTSAPQRAALMAEADDVFMQCLRVKTAQGITVSPKLSKSYAPAIFERMPEAKGYKATALADALERALSAGRVVGREVGSPSRRSTILVERK
jgi:RecA-family ATPase